LKKQLLAHHKSYVTQITVENNTAKIYVFTNK